MSPIAIVKLYLLTFLAVLSVDYGSAANKGGARIVGGTETTVAANPFLVSLLLNRGTELQCGGSLIKPRHVITAAHCIFGLLPRNLTVRGGSSIYNSGGVLRQVIRIARPGIYNDDTLNMDVAALKLRLDMSGANISVIPICSQTLFVNNTVTVAGWGQVSETNTSVPLQMRSVTLPVISNSACTAKYSDVANATVTSNMFCANINVVKGTCSGDSGGPLVFNGQLCGITSWGTACDLGYPSVFTRINSALVKGFIQRQTADTI